jgi:hypothetical protein
MRYFLVSYYKKPTGQMDEVVTVSRHVRNNDLSSCGVILDFRDRKVLKCSVNGQPGSRDFTTVRDYYNQHYANVIERLEREVAAAQINDKTNPTG